ncbi:ANTAR domain-containing protein [Amycolatopsis sp. CA-230715]|uniref:ANTAR domain-containing protein n=1 Tax=Amycolatopsis sp. CA-230715 TaxID=2745196 RepID=UPI001C013098|nr:ANTAR domain-containing protein [Amycolatopsis sp. CA-230715]QWF83490.1 hypothetical protein HUW46_06931 [Amycolatopsis sp. CA-230715]
METTPHQDHDQPGTTLVHPAPPTMPAIEQAKGMLMLARGCDADTAFGILRTLSQDLNLKVRDIAVVVTAIGSGEAAVPHLAKTVEIVRGRLQGLMRDGRP